MNYLFTGIQILQNKMLSFIEHPVFDKEFEKFNSKYNSSDSLKSLKMILTKQFNPEKPQLVIGPGKIHRVKACDNYDIWKVEMAVKGLRKNQSPRIWFALSGVRLSFLTIQAHMDNYDNNGIDEIAVELASDIFR